MEREALAKNVRCSSNHGTDIRRLDRLLRLLLATIVRSLGVLLWAFDVHVTSDVGVVDHLWVQGERTLWHECGYKDDNSKYGELRGEAGESGYRR